MTRLNPISPPISRTFGLGRSCGWLATTCWYHCAREVVICMCADRRPGRSAGRLGTTWPSHRDTLPNYASWALTYDARQQRSLGFWRWLRADRDSSHRCVLIVIARRWVTSLQSNATSIRLALVFVDVFILCLNPFLFSVLHLFTSLSLSPLPLNSWVWYHFFGSLLGVIRGSEESILCFQFAPHDEPAAWRPAPSWERPSTMGSGS